jgi:MYXO-CTERM domain-containing protein
VTFKDGSTELGTGTLDGAGVTSFTTSALSAGAHSIVTLYSGDGNFEPSTGGWDQQVGAYAATIAVTSSANPSTFGQEVLIKATLTGEGGTPTGTVTFKDGATTLGTGTLSDAGEAIMKNAALSVGVHSLVVEYGGDVSYASGTGSVSQTVDKAATTTSLEASTTAATFGDSVTFTATVTSAAAGIEGQVEFFDGSVSLGQVALKDGKATLASTTLTVGGHALSARYSGNASFAPSTSKAVSATINAKPADPTGTSDGGVDASEPSSNTDASAPAGTGCGCRTAPATPGPLGLVPLAGLALLFIRRGASLRRRSSRPKR